MNLKNQLILAGVSLFVCIAFIVMLNNQIKLETKQEVLTEKVSNVETLVHGLNLVQYDSLKTRVNNMNINISQYLDLFQKDLYNKAVMDELFILTFMTIDSTTYKKNIEIIKRRIDEQNKKAADNNITSPSE